MKFFIPQVEPKKCNEVYDEMVKTVKDQMKMPISERKIYSISYVHEKKNWHAEVGQPDPQRGKYEVLAIFESKPFVIMTRSNAVETPLMMLVTPDEITDIKVFE